MTRSTRKYTKEFKQEAITLALKSPSIGHTAKELGIPQATLHRWINDVKQTGSLGRVRAREAKDVAILIEENRRLQKELSIVKEEKEILKRQQRTLLLTRSKVGIYAV